MDLQSVSRLLFLIYGTGFLLIANGCVLTETPETHILYQTTFDDPDLSDWVIEKTAGTVAVNNGDLDIDVGAGCTVWFRQEFKAPVRIEFEVTVVDEDGPNDRVSDLNCFWMAIDPQHPEDLFTDHDQRTGTFSKYHPFRLYYAGMGGNTNSTTRFRRYPGTGERPLLPEHDLSEDQFMLQSNRRMHIVIVSTMEGIQYYRDGELIFDFTDPEPLTRGWFGFRTVHNHMRIHSFKVVAL